MCHHTLRHSSLGSSYTPGCRNHHSVQRPLRKLQTEKKSCRVVSILPVRLLLGSGVFSVGYNFIAPGVGICGNAVTIEWNLGAIGSLWGGLKYKSWLEDLASAQW